MTRPVFEQKFLEAHGLDFGALWKRDRAHSVSSEVGQSVDDQDQIVIVASAKAKTQLAALLDGIELHAANELTGAVKIHLSQPRPEALGALATMRQSMKGGPPVEVFVLDSSQNWVPAADPDWDIARAAEATGWLTLLTDVSTPHPIVSDLVAAVAHPAFRAYPMLTSKGWWSLRLEGLELCRLNAKGGQLGVGRDGAKSDGSLRQSAQRKLWIGATGLSAKWSVTPVNVAEAAEHILAFIDAWADPHKARQDEHALESRILRGLAPVAIDGEPLQLIRPNDGVVNWGSQFPTRWGPGGSSRYLDALLRRDNVPWAIEMKVQGAGGVGQYYRHAIAQAVLYREFIRQGTALHPWFTKQGLDAAVCEAAVVVPAMANELLRSRLQAMCQIFGVRLVEVDHAWAEIP
jgi:hypothetical protein